MRYAFQQVAPSLAADTLTPLRRQQLALAIELGSGRRTAPERLPKRYFDLPRYTELWHVFEGVAHRFDLILNTLFFAHSAEPVGVEWIQGSFEATGRDAVRGLALDLPRTAWELQRAWPGKKQAPDADPPDASAFRPEGPGLRDLAWSDDTEYV